MTFVGDFKTIDGSYAAVDLQSRIYKVIWQWSLKGSINNNLTFYMNLWLLEAGFLSNWNLNIRKIWEDKRFTLFSLNHKKIKPMFKVGFQNLTWGWVIDVQCIISNLGKYFWNLGLTKTKVFLNLDPKSCVIRAFILG